MIDILDLNEKSNEWVSDGLEFLTSQLTYGDALELTDRLIAAEKDAARYRWIARKVGAHGVIDGWAFSFPTNLSLPAPPIALSDPEYALGIAIDDAMKCSK